MKTVLVVDDAAFMRMALKCVVYGMPRVAYNIGAVDKQAPLDDIPRLLAQLVTP